MKLDVWEKIFFAGILLLTVGIFVTIPIMGIIQGTLLVLGKIKTAENLIAITLGGIAAYAVGISFSKNAKNAPQYTPAKKLTPTLYMIMAISVAIIAIATLLIGYVAWSNGYYVTFGILFILFHFGSIVSLITGFVIESNWG